MDQCAGSAAVFDIQASELKLVDDDAATLGDRQIRCLLEAPLLVKRFDFAPPTDRIRLQDTRVITRECLRTQPFLMFSFGETN